MFIRLPFVILWRRTLVRRLESVWAAGYNAGVDAGKAFCCPDVCEAPEDEATPPGQAKEGDEQDKPKKDEGQHKGHDKGKGKKKGW